MSQDIPKKRTMKKILISFLMAMLAGVLFSCAEEPAPDPVPNDKWLLISPSYASIYVGDEYVVSPKFSSEEAESLDYEWSVSDPEILSITEDNNTSVTVSGLKPGTTIQNGRTTSIGDEWDKDGYHLNTAYGLFAAACTWYETISGNSVLENAWKPSSVTDGQAEIARNAAHYAVEKPFEVTDMSDY